MQASDLTVWISFFAGFLSFISPCCLPLYPSYLSYITGVSVKDLRDEAGMLGRQAMLHTLFFILGFSIIFVALGLSASLIGNLFAVHRALIRQLGGVLVILMGFVMLGWLTPQWLMKERRTQFKSRPTGYIGSILVGISYAAGWTPCVGPILASIITLGVSNPSHALLYVAAYTLGFALPFVILAFFIGKIKWLVKYSERFMKVGGVLLLLTGVLLYFDQMSKITIWLIRLYGGFKGF